MQPAPDPRNIERDPPGKMEFPGSNPDEPAKRLARDRQLDRYDDETPGSDPELDREPDRPPTEKRSGV